MLSPKAVERREIGNPVSHLQSRKPFLGAIRAQRLNSRLPLNTRKRTTSNEKRELSRASEISEQFARLNRQSDATGTQLSRLAITLSIRADSSQEEVS